MKWFQNLNTMTKLMVSFGVVCLTLAVVGSLGLWNMSVANHDMDTLYERHMKGITAILEAGSDRIDVGRSVRQAIIESSPDEIRKQQQEAEAEYQDMQRNLDAAEKTLVTDSGRAMLKQMRDVIPGWYDGNRHALDLALAGRDAEAAQAVRENGDRSNRLSDLDDSLRNSKIKLGDEAVLESRRRAQRSSGILLALLLLGVAFAVGVGVVISRMIAGPLHEAADMLAKVAEGDFTRRLDIDTRDELGQLATSLNAAVGGMREALRSVARSASAVTTASGELSSASQSIASGAQEQASSLEETAASLEQMTSAVKQNADNAQQAAQLAQGAREVAEKGGQVVGSAVSAMTEINAASRKIADIITAIDEIAFQTNLLALNAAVEAARAGEQGRGFAVVAGEVRNLAQRSESAAKEIKGLITDSVDKVEAGSRLVNQSGATLEEIVTSVKRVTDIVGEIAASSREQSTGIEQVNTAVTQMDAVTQSNASQTEELAGTADALSHQAQEMSSLVSHFRLAGTGIAANPVPVPHRKVVPMPARRAPARSVTAPVESRATGTDGFEEF